MKLLILENKLFVFRTMLQTGVNYLNWCNWWTEKLLYPFLHPFVIRGSLFTVFMTCTFHDEKKSVPMIFPALFLEVCWARKCSRYRYAFQSFAKILFSNFFNIACLFENLFFENYTVVKYFLCWIHNSLELLGYL